MLLIVEVPGKPPHTNIYTLEYTYTNMKPVFKSLEAFGHNVNELRKIFVIENDIIKYVYVINGIGNWSEDKFLEHCKIGYPPTDYNK